MGQMIFLLILKWSFSKGHVHFSGRCSSSIFFPGEHLQGVSLLGGTFGPGEKGGRPNHSGATRCRGTVVGFLVEFEKGRGNLQEEGFSHEGLSFCFPDFFPPGFACYEIERFFDGKDLKNTTYPKTFCFE